MAGGSENFYNFVLNVEFKGLNWAGQGSVVLSSFAQSFGLIHN